MQGTRKIRLFERLLQFDNCLVVLMSVLRKTPCLMRSPPINRKFSVEVGQRSLKL